MLKSMGGGGGGGGGAPTGAAYLVAEDETADLPNSRLLKSPDIPPITPNPADDEFNGETLDTAGTRFSGATPWTWLNQGAAVAVLGDSFLSLKILAAPASALRGIFQPVSGTAWKYRTHIALSTAREGSFGAGAIYLGNSSGDALTVFGIYNVDGAITSVVWQWNSPTSFSGSLYAYRLNGSVNRYFEIERDGATLYFRVSETGAEGSFITIYSSAVGSTVTPDPDKIGLMFNCEAGSSTNLQSNWFRRIT